MVANSRSRARGFDRLLNADAFVIDDLMSLGQPIFRSRTAIADSPSTMCSATALQWGQVCAATTVSVRLARQVFRVRDASLTIQEQLTTARAAALSG
jgi:hypothetical protein